MIDLEAVHKVLEMGCIGVIIGEILCSFAYIDFPLLLILVGLWSQPQIDYVVKSIGVALLAVIYHQP